MVPVEMVCPVEQSYRIVEKLWFSEDDFCFIIIQEARSQKYNVYVVYGFSSYDPPLTAQQIVSSIKPVPFDVGSPIVAVWLSKEENYGF